MVDDDRSVVRGRFVGARQRVVGYRLRHGPGRLHPGHPIDRGPGHQQVVYQLAPSAVDAGVTVLLGDQRLHVPQPGPVAAVRGVEAAGADLRAGRPEQDLRGGCGRHVVEVTGDDEHPGPALVGQQTGDVHPDSGGFGGPTVQGIHGVARPLVLVTRAEAAAGEAEQLGLEVHRHDVHVDALHPHAGRQRGTAERVERVAGVVDLDRSDEVREPRDLVHLGQRGAGQHAHADATRVGGRQRAVPAALEPGDQVVERARGADLLHRQHVDG